MLELYIIVILRYYFCLGKFVTTYYEINNTFNNLPGRWRLMSAATRDHSLNVEMPEDVTYVSTPNESTDLKIICDESWHDTLCLSFIREYKQYLQTLGFVPLETDEKKYELFFTIQLNKINHVIMFREQTILKTNVNNMCYVQKPMLGGIMIFTIELNEPFFTVKLHAIECCRLQQKVSRNLFNQVSYRSDLIPPYFRRILKLCKINFKKKHFQFFIIIIIKIRL